jgi:uncharacterized membrane protein
VWQAIAGDGEGRERFKRRLEAFSDIVFGLSLSQLALQLELPAKASDLVDHPLRFALFFGTFALICLTWLVHHRMFQLAFEPEGLDVALNFTYLAFVAALPFAMQVNVRFAGTETGFAFYVADFVGTSIPMFCLLQRGLARRNPKLNDVQRLELWRAVVRSRMVLGASLVSLALIPLIGAGLAWIPFPLLGAGATIVRRVVKTVPERYRPSPERATPNRA